MKKLFLITGLLVCSITQAIAQPQVCPFADRFTISAASNIAITGIEYEGNVSGMVLDATHFTLYCKDNGSKKSGQAYLSVGQGSKTCHLTIVDGPFEMNPTVVDIRCEGDLHYIGVDHELGTYRYKLKFD